MASDLPNLHLPHFFSKPNFWKQKNVNCLFTRASFIAKVVRNNFFSPIDYFSSGLESNFVGRLRRQIQSSARVGTFYSPFAFFRGGGKFRNVEEKGIWKYLRMVESSKNQLSEKWMSCWFVTCSQCYKPFTGLYLQVCKTRPISQSFVAVNIDKFNTLMIALTL